MTPVSIFENARIVTADEVIDGYVVIDDGKIIEVGAGRAPERGHDLAGDLLIPGLVELHTDHLEAHYMPRPKVMWDVKSAVAAYDAQVAASGITTVFDSLRIGKMDYDSDDGFAASTVLLADALAEAQAGGHMRADHLTHVRCEAPAPDVVQAFEKFLASHPVHMISLMDHTPGQRQFRDLDKYFTYFGGKSGRSEAEVRAIVQHRQQTGADRAARNRPQLVEIARREGIRLASHDDTTLAEVANSAAEGVTLAEFPTTIEAAAASQEAGMVTIMGGPNVVRGGSHSGNVAARDLAEAGHLDILSSDYVPASLLLGAWRLQDVHGMGGLAGAIRLVTKNPAHATGLDDRGEIAIGKRADLVRLRLHGDRPLVREVYRAGLRVA